MQFSPIETPLLLDEIATLVGASFVEVSHDRRYGFLGQNCQHPNRLAPKFRYANLFDAFSYVLFRNVLPSSMPAKTRYEFGEALTDLVASFVESDEEFALTGPARKDLRPLLIQIATSIDFGNEPDSDACYEELDGFAMVVLEAWDSCMRYFKRTLHAELGPKCF